MDLADKKGMEEGKKRNKNKQKLPSTIVQKLFNL